MPGFLDLQFGPAAPLVLMLVFLIASFPVALAAPASRRRSLPLFWQAGALIAIAMDRKLNRARRSEPERFFRGFLLLLALLIFAYMCGHAVHSVSRSFFHGWIAELFFLALCISVAMPVRVLRRCARDLKAGNLAQARGLLDGLVPYDTAALDRHGVARAAIEFAAWALNRCIAGPVFWYLLLGPAGLAICVVIAAADTKIGGKDKSHESFGKSVALFDAMANYIPARLAVLLIVAGSLFISKARPIISVKNIFFNSGKNKSLNSGVLLAAMAGATGVALAGPIRSGSKIWIGDSQATAKAEWRHIRTAKNIFSAALLCLLAALVASVWLFIRFF